MKIAIMQPYLFPYIGYFQLINSVDVFVLYDDVNYIKQGWINRNNYLVNNIPKLLTIPLVGASSNKLINEILINKDIKDFNKFLITIEQTYKKAPFFDEIYPIIHDIWISEYILISDFIYYAIQRINEYLEIPTKICLSSEYFSEFKGLEKADRLIAIAKKANANVYMNPIGGFDLYDKKYFSDVKITLKFIKSKPIRYKQFTDSFISGLSIIDILMFNPKDTIHQFLKEYELL